MSDADRLFVACVVMVAVYVFRVWDHKRRRHQAMMAAHCARLELARIAIERGDSMEGGRHVIGMIEVEKGMGILQ